MGRGDKESAKGKRFKGSYGNSRPHKAKKVSRPVVPVKVTAAPKKEKPVKEKAPKVEKPAVVKKAPAKKAPKKKAEE